MRWFLSLLQAAFGGLWASSLVKHSDSALNFGSA